jgi:hypothetical protein
LLLLFMLSLLQIKAQTNCSFDRIKKEIELLKNQHEAAMPDKEFVKLSELTIENDGNKNQRLLNFENVIRFTFMGPAKFRYYVYSTDVDARIILKQRMGGFFEKKEETILLDVEKKGTDKIISYYDYEYENHNDFLLSFLPVNSRKGCAIFISYQIADKNWEYKRNGE